VAHGGANFGFTAGANSGGKGYEPDVTSYDYDAPIDEQGRPTPKFHALRRLIGAHLEAGRSLPDVPDPVPAASVPEFAMRVHASIWDNLPPPIASVQPLPFESYGQNQGLVLYRTRLVGQESGTLVGTLDRRLGEKSIDLPATGSPTPVLDILVEGMGHINYAQEMIDRKGITDRVSLSGMTLMNWDVFPAAAARRLGDRTARFTRPPPRRCAGSPRSRRVRRGDNDLPSRPCSGVRFDACPCGHRTQRGVGRGTTGIAGAAQHSLAHHRGHEPRPGRLRRRLCPKRRTSIGWPATASATRRPTRRPRSARPPGRH
jgi:hypothetical protein